jgi:ATPase family AAA domain-containing protein 3A/B
MPPKQENYDEKKLYRKVQAVNTSECLSKVKALPLKLFEFQYDTVKGRRQLGVIGSELESLLPESVDVVKAQAFKNPDGGLPGQPALVKLGNFPVVDKSVLFMYNVGAVQHLIGQHEDLAALVGQLQGLERHANESLALLEGRIDAEVGAAGSDCFWGALLSRMRRACCARCSSFGVCACANA